MKTLQGERLKKWLPIIVALGLLILQVVAPVNTYASVSPQIAAGGGHNVVLKSDGTVPPCVRIVVVSL